MGAIRARLDDWRCDPSICVCVPGMILGLLCTTVYGLVGSLRGAGVERGALEFTQMRVEQRLHPHR